MGNYSFKEPPPADNGAVIEGHNFTQAIPHTKIYAGVTGLTFRNCNLTNCDIPDDAITERCAKRHIEFCSNLHPEWVQQHGIESCELNCSHCTVVDTIMVDGVLVDTTYSYQDVAVQ